MKKNKRPEKSSEKKAIKYVEFVIRDQLYPEESFPLYIFPDLIPLLSTLFFKVKKDTEKSSEKKSKNCFPIDKENIIKTLNISSLIKNHTDVLILLYRNLISNYISRKHFNKNEVEDIVQEIITKILDKKIERIRNTFNFSDTKNPTFTSYFMVTIRNIYIDMLRKKKLLEKEFDAGMNILNEAEECVEDGISNLIIDEELQKLEMLLSLYRKNHARIILTLKIKYHQKPLRDEILSCFKHCSKKDIELLSSDFSTLYERRIFEIITPVFNRNSSLKLKPDSLRKWISDIIGDIRIHMNNTHLNNPYDSKNISDLFLIFFNRNPKIRRMKNVS